MGRRLVLAGGELALVVVLAVLLLHHAPRRSGTNMAPNPAFVAILGQGHELCQGQDLLPGDTEALDFTIGTYGAPGPQLALSIKTAAGAVLTEGGLPTGWRQGAVSIPVRRVHVATEGSTMCLRNLGAHKIAIAGYAPDPGNYMQEDGKTIPGHVRIEYLRSTHESWFALLGTIAHRFSLGKSNLLRHWAVGAVLALMLLAIALATRTILKEEL
jgi:hypothetical protein